MQIHRDNVIGTGYRQHVCDQFGGDGRTALQLGQPYIYRCDGGLEQGVQKVVFLFEVAAADRTRESGDRERGKEQKKSTSVR